VKHAVQHIHFVGIGGAGMSGIAEILHNLGYAVSGSDVSEGEAVQRLRGLGLRVQAGHAAEHAQGADAVVVSTAVAASNPEVQWARAHKVPVVPRAVMLAELMRLKRGIAIAGTHGKTTTTSLVASVLAEAGLDPTFVIGGRLVSAGANSRLGAGEFIVVEADESDASFLNLSPVISVVTNIDEDHMDTYGHKRDALDQAFVDFLHRLPFYGTAIVCADDPGVMRIVPRLQRRVLGVGLSEAATIRADEVQALPGGLMQFKLLRPGRPPLPVTLQLAGRHNVRNALAAVAVAELLDVPDEALLRALAQFAGVGRRFQPCGRFAVGGGQITVIDDYGHHPAEMAAVLTAARGAFPGARLLLAFQPHRYTRTRDCFDGFVNVLSQFDAVLLADVYAAGEQAITGASSAALAEALEERHGVQALVVGEVSRMPSAIAAAARAGDVVVTMGAGSIAQVPGALRGLLLPLENAA
jgi:UDP-N-acetylmuramate--alanine ligase